MSVVSQPAKTGVVFKMSSEVQSGCFAARGHHAQHPLAMPRGRKRPNFHSRKFRRDPGDKTLSGVEGLEPTLGAGKIADGRDTPRRPESGAGGGPSPPVFTFPQFFHSRKSRRDPGDKTPSGVEGQ